MNKTLIDGSDDFSKERAEALASVKDTLLSFRKSIEIAERNEQEIDYDARNEALDYEIREEKIKSRKKWDRWLLRLVIIGFFLSYAMIVMIGLKWLTFADSTFAVPSVVAAGVIETYGLAKIAARYFFSDDPKKERKK